MPVQAFKENIAGLEWMYLALIATSRMFIGGFLSKSFLLQLL